MSMAAKPERGVTFDANVRIATQLNEDCPSSIIDVATALIGCDTGSWCSIDRLNGHFRLTEDRCLSMAEN